MKNPVLISLFMMFLFVFGLHAQEGSNLLEYDIPGPERRSLAPENPEELPRHFRNLALGMSLNDLKSVLAKDMNFAFRGDRDVSFLPVREQTLVETAGISYIRRAYFQLVNESVYIMSFSLDTRIMDHYSVFTTFIKKYGEPKSLSPGEAVWDNGETRISIERPLTVKYIDRTVFDRLIADSRTGEKLELMAREEFLSDF